MSNLDLDLVKHALTVARTHGFAEVELVGGQDRFSARLELAVPSVGRPAAPETSPLANQEHGAIKATLVGYYRPAKNPLAPGMRVEKGDLVAIIAALGIANDVESTVSGEVMEVLVTPNQPVEYGQVLAKVKS
jgi:biotin carboxyl carrier protein